MAAPKPPERYGDLSELENAFIDALPKVTGFMASALGRRPPRIARKDQALLRRKLRRHLETSRPYLLGLGALQGTLEPHRATYSLLEGLRKEELRAAGLRVRQEEDAFDVGLKLATKAAQPRRGLAAHQPYLDLRTALLSIIERIQTKIGPSNLEIWLSKWSETTDARKHVAAVRHLSLQLPSFRHSVPKRCTDKLIVDLSREYKECASILEQRLRLLVALVRLGTPLGKKWEKWRGENFNNILAMAAADPHLASFSKLVDRNVRNTLAHSVPEVEFGSGACHFHDREKTVSWSFTDFYEKTQALAIGTVALIDFEALLCFMQAQAVAHGLWSQYVTQSVPGPTSPSSPEPGAPTGS